MIIVDALATYRLVRLYQEDSFPPAARLRAATLGRTTSGSAVEELLTCPWCLSMWVGVSVAAARRYAPRQWSIVSFGLAASAVTGIVTTLVEKLEAE